ncbi:MAG: hypothetical protein L0287_27290, partial [Anaerolineae bacterium]|nr:hypothetical protein [Anaerolineae bacterium]
FTGFGFNANGTACKLFYFYRFTDGTEGATATMIIDPPAQCSASVCYQISGMHATEVPAKGIAVTATTANPNPPSLNPSGWDVEDTLWIAVCGWDDGDIGASAYPSGYGNTLARAADSVADGVGCASATKGSAAASEDPGTFTITASRASVAQTIAIRPAQFTVSGTIYQSDGTAMFDNAPRIVVNYSGTITGTVNSDVNANYTIAGIPAGANLDVWCVHKTWLTDQDPTASQDHWDLDNITSNLTSKNFKVRNKTDSQWVSTFRPYVGRYPITFNPAAHLTTNQGSTVKGTFNLGLHKKIHSQGVFQAAVQEMSQSVIVHKDYTHIFWIGHADMGSTSLSVFGASYNNKTKTWGSVQTIAASIGADTH